MTDHLVVLLHLCDSLFPIGSFAHSDGLEAATSRGDIQTTGDLRGWMDVTLTEILARVEGPGVARAWQLTTERRLEALASLDQDLYALRPTSAGREAARAMGTRLLKTWQHLRPGEAIDAVLAARNHLTLPVAFGAVAAASAIPVRSAVEGFCYTRLAAIVSAAMRLMPLGQRDGHRLLAEQLARVPAILDVMAMSQQYVESRLFKS
jgi:urease accessory protein